MEAIHTTRKVEYPESGVAHFYATPENRIDPASIRSWSGPESIRSWTGQKSTQSWKGQKVSKAGHGQKVHRDGQGQKLYGELDRVII